MGEYKRNLLSTNFLALRPGEDVVLHRHKPDARTWERVYRVALVPVPLIKEKTHTQHGLAVVCAEFYPTKESGGEFLWGWVHLEESAKKLIGHTLLRMDVEKNTWVWMVIDTRQRGQR